MSKAKIKDKVKLELAIKSGGCCERCGIYIYEDFLTKTPVKFSEHAHIIPDSDNDNAPRAESYVEDYDRESCENLMVLCSSCHTIIDKVPEQFPRQLLIDMKRQHEERIKYLVSLKEDREINTVIFSARIKNKDTFFSKDMINQSILHDGYYPKNNCLFDLSCNPAIDDDDPLFYKLQVQSLIKNFEMNKQKLMERKSILFALAPQPLLIRLGMLLNKTSDVCVKQKIRVPDGWDWVYDSEDIKYEVAKPEEVNIENEVCLIFSISDTVDKKRIDDVINSNKDLWTVSIKHPNMNSVLKSKHVEDFSILCMDLLNEIKNIYGINKSIHVFPIMPNSLSIEFGRSYMPKIHNNLILYDQIKNQKENRFAKAFSYLGGNDVFENYNLGLTEDNTI